MEFKFKRKYDGLFFFALILHTLVAALYIFFPKINFLDPNHKLTIILLLLINIELILALVIVINKKKYHVFYNNLTVCRTFLKNLSIPFTSIDKISEKNSDSILLFFGNRPSIKIFYRNKSGRIRSHTVRSDNNALLLKTIQNELKILKKINTNREKFTK